jgi:predicted DNA-binding transcriptional regulator AlpA
MLEKQLRAKEVAATLNICLRTLEDRIRAGNAPQYYWVGRCRRWEPEVVRAWIRQNGGDADTALPQS